MWKVKNFRWNLSLKGISNVSESKFGGEIVAITLTDEAEIFKYKTKQKLFLKIQCI